jgi:hypothetical protein
MGDRTGKLDPQEREKKTYRFRKGLSPGDRLSAVCELSMAAYGFKADGSDVPRLERTLILRKGSEGEIDRVS